MVTSDFPGSFTMVCRPAKGPAVTFNWMVGQHYTVSNLSNSILSQVKAKGMVGSCTDGTNTATFSYKRIPDIVVGSHQEPE